MKKQKKIKNKKSCLLIKTVHELQQLPLVLCFWRSRAPAACRLAQQHQCLTFLSQWYPVDFEYFLPNIKGCFSFSGLLMDHRLCLSFYAPWLINISWCQGVSESEVCRDRFPAVQEGGTLCMPNAKARTTSLSVKTGWETIGHSCKPQTIHKRCLYRACLCALCRSSPLCSLYWVIKERGLKSPAFVGDDVLLSTLCMMLQFLIIASEIKYFGLLGLLCF